MQLFLEIIRPWLFATAFGVICVRQVWWLAVPLGLATFLAAFVQLHDAMHAALGLPKWANELLITLAGGLLLKSGHGLRVTHLRHHGKCLDEDDPEGKVVHWPLWRVVLAGPFHVLGNRTLAMRLAPRNAREQMGETALNVLFAVGAVALWIQWDLAAGLVYWAIVGVMSSTLALWAAYLPHKFSSRHPLVRGAAWASRLWTPVVNSFAFHHLHHRFPKVPTALLGELSRAVGPEMSEADETLHR